MVPSRAYIIQNSVRAKGDRGCALDGRRGEFGLIKVVFEDEELIAVDIIGVAGGSRIGIFNA